MPIEDHVKFLEMNISRKELYDLVWAEPMTSICTRFGLSVNGLRKHCKSMNIPIPTVGYWSKLEHGKSPEIIILPPEHDEVKQSTVLNEVDQTKESVINLTAPVNRFKNREFEIGSGDTASFVVPEVLYAKDTIIIDTKEKHRLESENIYLKRNPYKSKIGPTLDLYVSDKSMDRALSIFATVINALRFRGHNIKVTDQSTLAVIQGEEIKINLTERRKQDKSSENPYYSTDFCGELQFNIFYGYRDWDTWKEKDTIKDTPNTIIEDKIVSIIANLEVRAEKNKEKRTEDEIRRLKYEQEELERKNFEEKKKSELNEFKSLFKMAERLHKTLILRQYIDTYEQFISKDGEISAEIAQKIQWAREKADWLDPFIDKNDLYMDYYDKDEVIRHKCPNANSGDCLSYSGSSGYSF
ncbi:MAG: hypothetical protein WCP85_08710 [Mariniphaga sp.]